MNAEHTVPIKISTIQAVQWINKNCNDVICIMSSRKFRLEEDILANKPDPAEVSIHVPVIYHDQKMLALETFETRKIALLPGDPYDHHQWMATFWEYFEIQFSENLLKI